jgi:hypothetical protein
MAVVGCDAGEGAAGIAPPWPTPGPGAPSGDDLVKRVSNLLQPHRGVILPAMGLRAVYVGAENVDGVPSRDDFLSWILTGDDYWSVLGAYGVGAGAFLGSERVPTATFFSPEVLTSGSITETALAESIYSYLTSDATYAVAYIFFMPTTVGITYLDGGARESCSAFGGYHAYIGLTQGPALPYAIIPPCPGFPADMPISHELAEMATDPTFDGWYSDQSGEEVGDICNFPVSQPIHLWSPTRLWSNADSACVPP